MRPAHHYRLTNNTTTFEIDAPTTGVAVLLECADVLSDILASVDDKPAWPFMPINHAFRGVYIATPGHHVVRFEYWPAALDRAINYAMLGFPAGAGADDLLVVAHGTPGLRLKAAIDRVTAPLRTGGGFLTRDHDLPLPATARAPSPLFAHLIPSLILAVVATVLFWWNPFGKPPQWATFHVRLKADVAGQTQLLHDVDGTGLHKGKLLSQPIEGGNRLNHVQFRIPTGRLCSFHSQRPGSAGGSGDREVLDHDRER